jgi:hypothetical protein
LESDADIANKSFEKVEKLKYLGTTKNKSKLHSRRNSDQISGSHGDEYEDVCLLG